MKPRVRDLGDGGREITRLISPDDLDETSRVDPLFFEKSLVWLEDLEPIRFVRLKTVRMAHSRRGPLYLGGDGRVVGYSKLTPDAPRDPETGGYVRRVFYLRSSDLESDAQIPLGAVDPATVLPGVEGRPLSISETAKRWHSE